MHTPALGFCTGPENVAAIKSAGADFLEVNVQSFLVPNDEDARFAPNLETAKTLDLPIQCANCFLPGSLPCVGPAVDSERLRVYASQAFARAAAVGIECIVFGSGAARKVPEGFSMTRAFDQLVSFLKDIAPFAENSGVTLVIEPLNTNECNLINTLQEGAELAAACAHSNIALLADTYHMGFSGEGPDTVREFGKSLRHFHVAEYPSRHYPGGDGQSYHAYFEALRDVGYQGRVSVECKWQDLAEDARQSVASLRGDWSASG